MPTVTLNGIALEVAGGATILEAARQAGIRIPTLCFLEGREPLGACRVCLVEVQGARTLQPACATPVSDGMTISTNTRRVREARRTVVQLLLSEHEGDCKTCARNEDCELQTLARELGITRVVYEGERAAAEIDATTPALVRDAGKCIKCRRCVTACAQVQAVGSLFPQGRGFRSSVGPAFARPLDSVVCVQCGQCAAVCPVGSITEKDHIEGVWKALDDPDKWVVVQTAPAIRVALGECFGLPPGTRVTGQMVTALRRLGFDAVFDTNFAADLTILEEGSELLERLKAAAEGKAVPLPLITSCSPGWIKFAEHCYPEFLPHLSTCKSPQQMFGAVAKTYYASKLGRRPQDIVVVSVMPCTAKKFEAQRPEMNASGVTDVDYVLTTRELGRMIREAGLNFTMLPEAKMDAPLGLSTGAADIFATTGGVMEAALRTAYEIVTGRPLPWDGLHVIPVMGLAGVKEACVRIEGTQPEWRCLEGVDLRVAVAHGLGHARSLLERLRGGASYHFIEIMACPGGCIGGGGQPRMTTNEVRQKRLAAIYAEDESKALRKSHENPEVAQLYREFLGYPLSELSHKLLHTHYTPRPCV